jgi:3-phenylpropionate/trans-cinnamate dioxygenase ferredoxin subunit
MSDDADFERVCAASELRPGALRAVTLDDGTRVCVGNRDGTVFAVTDRCPHQKFPLSEGALIPDGTIVCARHGAAYDCVTGRGVRGPLRDRGVREGPLGRLGVYEVRVTGDDVFVRPPTPDPRLLA